MTRTTPICFKFPYLYIHVHHYCQIRYKRWIEIPSPNLISTYSIKREDSIVTSKKLHILNSVFNIEQLWNLGWWETYVIGQALPLWQEMWPCGGLRLSVICEAVTLLTMLWGLTVHRYTYSLLGGETSRHKLGWRRKVVWDKVPTLSRACSLGRGVQTLRKCLGKWCETSL